MRVPGQRGFETQLVRDGVVDEPQLAQARSHAADKGQSLAEALVAGGFASADAVYRSLAGHCGYRFVTPSKLAIAPALAQKVPARFATHYRFVPIEDRGGMMVVAVSNPLDTQLLDDIRLVLKCRMETVVATPAEVDRATKTLYGVGAETVERLLSDAESAGRVVDLESAAAGADLGDESIDASIVKFVNELISEAIANSATDIHVEPFENELRVRYRIDGILHGVPTPPSIRGLHAAIVSRVKIMANLDIAERRMPQDGKIRAALGEEQFDLRVSILPTPHGETVNLRILNRSSMFMTLEQLGFQPDDLERFNAFVRSPHGMVLLTGPTGSGKTTTLYAALSKLNSLEHKVITIEDPIEYQLHGITQMEILPRIGFDFTTALRSMLRHDPDIMLVGEIRDYETAEMAVRSSLTGHLVFSTLHTNDAAGAVTRLTDMGVEPFLIASTMIASIAQRLVRVVCEACAEHYEPDPEILARYGWGPEAFDAAEFRRGQGCDACRNTGFSGRMAIYEILPFTDPIKKMTVERRPSTAIKQKACQLGMRTLRESGWELVRQGRTTLEEVARVTAEADLTALEETGDAALPV
jgi:general secretion pathway protein E